MDLNNPMNHLLAAIASFILAFGINKWFLVLTAFALLMWVVTLWKFVFQGN